VLKLTKHPAHYTCTYTSNQVYKPGDRPQTMFAQLMSAIIHCACIYTSISQQVTITECRREKIMNECLHNKKGEPIPFTQIARPVITVVHNARHYIIISAMNLRLVMTSAMICTSYRVIQKASFDYE